MFRCIHNKRLGVMNFLRVRSYLLDIVRLILTSLSFGHQRVDTMEYLLILVFITFIFNRTVANSKLYIAITKGCVLYFATI